MTERLEKLGLGRKREEYGTIRLGKVQSSRNPMSILYINGMGTKIDPICPLFRQRECEAIVREFERK